jgi:hypothetical protein
MIGSDIELSEPQRAAVAVVQRDSLVRVDPATGAALLYHDGAPAEVIRARVERLKDFLLSLPDVMNLHVEHEVCGGMYLRKLFIPAGALLVGKVHLKPCHNVVASGEISVLTEHGCKRIGAGFTGMSTPGTQKVGLAHKDTVFINVFCTDKTELADIEAEIACEASAEDRKGMLCL